MTTVACIEDLRELSKRRVPKAFYDYICAGSYGEETLRANREDMQRIKLRQRVLVDMANRDLTATIIGQKSKLPFGLAPVAMIGMQHGDGEILAAKAANEAGIPFTLSTMSINSIEDIAEATGKPFWFQLYVMRDRGFIRELIKRAENANCSALVLTVDLQVLGQRHCDVRNGLSVPPKLKPHTLIEMMMKPRWVASVLAGKRWTFGNLAGHVKGMDNVKELSAWTATQFDQALNWKDIEWIKSLWPRKLVLKGILDTEDARLAVKSGADAIVVSNHGGRQLDGTSSSIAMLPRIADAVGSDIEVMFDGGIRTGADIVRAIALGARFCLIGRAFAWAVGAGGQQGVAKAIELLGKELDTTMALCGVTTVKGITRDVVDLSTVPGAAAAKANGKPPAKPVAKKKR